MHGLCVPSKNSADAWNSQKICDMNDLFNEWIWGIDIQKPLKTLAI